MRYYFYRIQKEDFENLEDVEKIKIDYLPIPDDNEDKFIIFTSQEMKLIGAYKKVDDYLIMEKMCIKDLTIRDFYTKLSIITEVSDRTYKVFAKKAKEISKEDYELLIESF